MKKDLYELGCFCGSWTEFEEVKSDEVQELKAVERKSLEVLLAELNEIKENFEKINEKKARLHNLLKFYNNQLLQN